MPSVLSTTDTTVSSGAFNKRVSIEQPVDVSDDQGGETRTWILVISTWAHIEPWKGVELWQAGQVYPILWTRVLLRYRPTLDITATMRLRYGRKIYNIRGVEVPAEAQTTIQLLCEQLQSSGTLH